MPLEATGQKKVRKIIIEMIRHCQEAGQNRLPTLREITKESGVSYITAAKALKVLEQEGILEASQGKGIFIKSDGPDKLTNEPMLDKPASKLGFKWQIILAKIKKDLMEGVLSDKTRLPSYKYLCQKYGVTYSTLKKVIAQLITDGFIFPETTGFSIKRLSSGAQQGVIILMVRGREDLLQLSLEIQSVIENIQEECARYEVKLQVLLYNYIEDRFTMSSKSKEIYASLNRDSILGYVIFSYGMSAENSKNILGEVMHTGKPVSFIDDSGNIPWAAYIRQHGLTNLQIFSFSNSKLCGLKVGRFLIEQGHHAALFFNPLPHTHWTKNRLAGVREAFKEAGLPRSVKEITLPFEERNFGPEEEKGYSLPALLRNMLSDFPLPETEFWNRLKRAIPSASQLISRNLKTTWILDNIGTYLGQALKKYDSVTAWIGANDLIAIGIMQYFQKRGIAVPREKSFIGFDNTLLSTLYEISSYNFNLRTVIVSALRNIIEYPGLKKSFANPHEVDGSIVERTSTGPASN